MILPARRLRVFRATENQLTKSIGEWERAGLHELTRGGRMKLPPPTIAVAWLNDAWEFVHQSAIKFCFTRCTLGNNEELHLSRHARLRASFLHRLDVQGGEQAQVDWLQGILDEFDDLFVVCDV